MLRVAAAESPSAEWGGQDVSAYDAAPPSPTKALGFTISQGDMFGTSRQASTWPRRADESCSQRICYFTEFLVAA